MPPRRNRFAFTLIELLVVIGIIAVLAAIAFPVFSTVQERARVTQDMNNLRQLGLGTQMYLNDNDGVLFLPDSSWPLALQSKYLSSWKVFLSPFDKGRTATADPYPVSYGMNTNAKSGATGLAADKITNPSVFIVYAAAPEQADPIQFKGDSTKPKLVNTGTSGSPAGTHGNRKRIDTCMADWHVENIDWSTFSDASSTTTAKQRWDPLAQ